MRTVRQPHLDLLAVVKLLTEATTLKASFETVAICDADGLDDKAVTDFLSASTDEVMALVWLGKWPLAELESVAASLSILLSCDFRPLTPLLAFRLVSPLMDFCKLVRSAQYAGLLLVLLVVVVPLLQPANAMAPIAAARVTGILAQVPPGRVCVAMSASQLALVRRAASSPVRALTCRLAAQRTSPEQGETSWDAGAGGADLMLDDLEYDDSDAPAIGLVPDGVSWTEVRDHIKLAHAPLLVPAADGGDYTGAFWTGTDMALVRELGPDQDEAVAEFRDYLRDHGEL